MDPKRPNRNDNDNNSFINDSAGHVCRRVFHEDPINIVKDIGLASNIGAALNSEFVFDNDRGYATIGLRVVPPTGGTVVFEGSFDGTNYELMPVRSTTTDEYRTQIASTHNIIGSIAALRKFRVRVSIAGSAAGSAIGRVSNQMSLLEGIEFSNAAHKSGYIPMHKDFSFSVTQTNTAIWTPASGRRFVITDFILTISSTNTVTVQIFDHTNAAGNYLYTGTIRAANLVPIFAQLKSPFVSSAADNILRFTNSGNFDIGGTMFGYEI